MRARPAVRFRSATAMLVILFLVAISSFYLATDVRSASTTPPPPASTAGRPVAAETYLWRPVAIGGGGFITGMSNDRAGRTRVIRTDVHGAYLWNDADGSWSQLVTAASMPVRDRTQDGMNEGVFDIAVAPNDAKRLYMAIKGRVYRSDDGGTSWISASEQPPFPLVSDPNSEFRHYGPFLAVSPDDADIVFFGTPANGLWRSSDAGAQWAQVGTVPPSIDLRSAAGIQAPGTLIWFAPKAAGGQVWAASAGHGILVARTPEGDFAPLTPAGQAQPLTIAQGGFAPDGSFFAVDTEASRAWIYRQGKWIDLTARADLPNRRFTGVAIDPRDGHILVVDEGGGAWCSHDAGRSWAEPYRTSEVGAGDPPWLRISDRSYFASGHMTFDPVVPNRVWVNAGTGPYYADIGTDCTRLAWKSRAKGIEEIVANDVLQPPGRAPLFAGWDFGIHVKPDLNAFSTTYGPKERVLIAAQQLDWSPSNTDFIVTNASDTRMDCCSEDGDAVLAGYSGDGGRSWSKFKTLPQPPGTRADDPWRMSFGTIAVSADSVDNIVWAPAFNRSPFYTLDRGASWSRVVLPGEVLPFTGSYARNYGTRKTLAADRVRPGTFYLYHSGDDKNAALAGIWRTGDGGRNWRHVFSGELVPNSQNAAKLRAVPGHAGHLFFTSAAPGSDTVLRRSIDGGVSWQRLDGVDRVDDVAFGKAAAAGSYPTIFLSGQVGGRYGIWRSTDDAVSWQRVAGFPIGRLDQVTAIEADKDVFGRVYVGYMGSGWLYGEPAKCEAEAFRPGADHECHAVDAGR